MPARAPAVLIGLAVLVGCTASPSPSPSDAGSEAPAVDACPPITLRSPSGAAIDLTDRWRSPDGGNYYLRQVASCVWFAGFSGNTGAPGREQDSDWTNSFFGHLSENFTLHGDWSDLPWGDDEGVGTLDWQLTFADVEDEEAITLAVTDASGGFGAQFLAKPERHIELTVRLLDDECLTVETDDGTAYQIQSLPEEWGFTTPPGLLGPNSEDIAPSESLVVSGDVARGDGFCGPALLLFADEIRVIEP